METKNTAGLLDDLRGAGFELSLHAGGGLAVAPAAKITDEIRSVIRQHKADLVALLENQNGLTPKLINASRELDRQIAEHDAWCEARGLLKRYQLPKPSKVQEPPDDTSEPIPPFTPMATPKAPPWHHIDAGWHAMDQAYHQHHFACPTCISAGQGRGQRCETGHALWLAYSEALERAPHAG